MNCWTVVHFIEEETVEAVPTSWVHGETCYWPPFIGSKLTHSINNCETPILSTWTLHKIRELGDGRTYDTLQKAKAKAVLAEETSDLTSDYDAKRIHKKKRFFDDNEDSLSSHNSHNSSFEDEISSNLKLPEPPNSTDIVKKDAQLNTQLSSIKSQESLKETSHMQHKATYGKKIVKESNEIQKSVKTYSPKSKLLRSNKESIPHCSRLSGMHYNSVGSQKTHAIENKVQENINKENNNINENKSTNEFAFQQQVLRQLHSINFRIQQVQQDMNLLMENRNKEDNKSIEEDNAIFNKFEFPLKTETEMHELEEYLTNKEHANQFVKELIEIGGLSHKSMTRRILQKLFSDNIAQTYSWVGFKGKKNFSILHVTSTILTAVKKIHATSLADIEKVIKLWLVKAKERQEKETKTLKKPRLTI